MSQKGVTPKSWLAPKSTQKKDDFEVPPQGVNQLLHVDQI